MEEIPAYAASGRGEHLFITFRKRGITTPDALRMIAEALGVEARAAGAAGMKDRHAVTTQTASFPVPMARDAEAAVRGIAIPGIEILAAARHDNKLKPGHLIGNRFTIALREVDANEAAGIVEKLGEIGRIGVPNAFGSQRFGRDGDNPARAIAWLSGKERGPRDRRQQTMLFSALQSLLFNRVLQRREAAGTWAGVLPGDVAKKHDTGGLFTVPLEGPEMEDARARGEAGTLSATGPMFGAKMRWPEGEPAAIERAVLAEAGPEIRFEAWKHLGEGTRRALRLLVAEMDARVEPEGAGKVSVIVRFVLPKGGYATTVLGRASRLIDATAPRGGRGPEAGPGAEPVDGASDDVQEP
ncbi:MAG: tRNA pseudouridine(13) synthase TruD [Minicystis sp.]